MTKENNELTELNAKLEIYEKWHNEESKFSNLNSPYSAAQSASEEIDLKELWTIIWAGKWKIIAITAVFAIASVFYALSLPNIYKSEALLMPNSQEQGSGGLGALAGQFGGLASLAGINLGRGGTDKTGYALEVLKSREFLYKFIQDNDLKVTIMAIKGWNRETNSFTFNSDIYDVKNKSWTREVKGPYKSEPSLYEVYEKFIREHLSVNQDSETGMIKLQVSHYSPVTAKYLVEKLTSAINEIVKLQDMQEAEQSINYFENELNNTAVTGAQVMFYQLIEQQQQTLMLTKVREDYVFKVIDRPIVAEKKVAPSRALICILGTILGSIFSILFVVVLNYIGSFSRN